MGTTDTTTLALNVIMGKDDVTNTMNKISGSIENIGKLSQQGILDTTSTQQRIKAVKKLIPGMGKDIDQAFKRGSRSAGQFDARLLSLLFGGMALQRAFGGFLRSVKDTFQKADDGTSGLGQATTRLSAAWEFLKFSIFEVLNTPFFINMIDGVIKWIDALSESKGALSAILFGTVSLAAIGTAMMTIGQISLGWNSIFGMGGFIKAGGTLTGGAAVIGLSILGIVIAITSVGVALTTFKEETKPLVTSIKGSFSGLGETIEDFFDRIGIKIETQNFLMKVFGTIGVSVLTTLSLAFQPLIITITTFLGILTSIKDIFSYISGDISFDDLKTNLKENADNVGAAWMKPLDVLKGAGSAVKDIWMPAMDEMTDKNQEGIDQTPDIVAAKDSEYEASVKLTDQLWEEVKAKAALNDSDSRGLGALSDFVDSSINNSSIKN